MIEENIDGPIREAITSEGEVLPLGEAVKTLRRPPYWARAEGIIEGETGQEYEEGFLLAQIEIGPLVEAEAASAFSKKKYASLAKLLSDILPIANKHGFTLKSGPGRIIWRSEGPKQLVALPIWTMLRHVATGQWERVYIEMPLVRVDPQAIGSAFTYGRRYLLQALFQVASTDDDGVLAGYKPSLTADPIGEAADGLAVQINECKTIEALKAWYSKNEEGFALLSEPRLDELRKVYGKRQEELKALPQEDKAAKKKPA